MGYAISGHFIEACDCKVMCPCWIDDDPDEGHCTGLFAWSIGDQPGDRALIDGVDVAGRRVVSVSTHDGNRRGGGATTVLYVDKNATDEQFARLVAAFSGALDGSLRDLASVSGTVLQCERAEIAIDPADRAWEVNVQVPVGSSTAPLVHATGQPVVFDNQGQPLTLRHTALSHELGVPFADAVTAQRGTELKVNLPALPAGYLEVTARSGMTGRFAYRYDDAPGD